MFLLVRGQGHEKSDGTGDDGDDAGIRPRRRVRVLKITGLALAGLLVLGAGAAGWVYWQLDDNIRSVDINSALGDDRPAKALPTPSATAAPLPTEP
ncbi:hypothetical protein SHKM778_09620 [Streptomyces sp. KM77-8]|uniref:LytR family transcriptional regulator n=1 Tax=Streptomyces haneummycinicus TaxID=3074435 RepID=A0AAT9HB07_9ACTN